MNADNILGGFTAAFGDTDIKPGNDDLSHEGRDIYSESFEDEPEDLEQLSVNPAVQRMREEAERKEAEEAELRAKEGKKPASNKTPKPEVEDEDDDEEEEEEIKPKTPAKTPPKNTKEEDDDLFEDEAIVATALYEQLATKLGLELSDEDSVDSIEGLVGRIYDIVEENSVPEYASDEMEKLDEFVRNGGKLTDFIEISSKYEATDSDLKNDDGRRKIVSTYLTEQGYTKAQIDKKLDKYELAGILEDEAEDAFEKLEVIKEKKQKTLLENAAKVKVEQEKRQQELYNNVVTTIKGFDEINGVTVTSKEKRELVKYLFEPTKSGLTQWQEDGKDVKNIVTAAFIMRNGTSLIDTAKRKGKSEAFAKIKEGMRNPKASKSRQDRFAASQDVDETMAGVSASINKLFGRHS